MGNAGAGVGDALGGLVRGYTTGMKMKEEMARLKMEQKNQEILNDQRAKQMEIDAQKIAIEQQNANTNQAGQASLDKYREGELGLKGREVGIAEQGLGLKGREIATQEEQNRITEGSWASRAQTAKYEADQKLEEEKIKAGVTRDTKVADITQNASKQVTDLITNRELSGDQEAIKREVLRVQRMLIGQLRSLGMPEAQIQEQVAGFQYSAGQVLEKKAGKKASGWLSWFKSDEPDTAISSEEQEASTQQALPKKGVAAMPYGAKDQLYGTATEAPGPEYTGQGAEQPKRDTKDPFFVATINKHLNALSATDKAILEAGGTSPKIKAALAKAEEELVKAGY
jgi:hypothetical protein